MPPPGQIWSKRAYNNKSLSKISLSEGLMKENNNSFIHILVLNNYNIKKLPLIRWSNLLRRSFTRDVQLGKPVGKLLDDIHGQSVLTSTTIAIRHVIIFFTFPRRTFTLCFKSYLPSFSRNFLKCTFSRLSEWSSLLSAKPGKTCLTDRTGTSQTCHWKIYYAYYELTNIVFRLKPFVMRPIT